MGIGAEGVPGLATEGILEKSTEGQGGEWRGPEGTKMTVKLL